jgi:hypothetical protein
VISHVALAVLASGEAKKSGPIGLAVILILCVACYFLFKSMSRHMRKVREQFPGEEPRLPEPDDPRTLPTPRATDGASPNGSAGQQPPDTTES